MTERMWIIPTVAVWIVICQFGQNRRWPVTAAWVFVYAVVAFLSQVILDSAAWYPSLIMTIWLSLLAIICLRLLQRFDGIGAYLAILSTTTAAMFFGGYFVVERFA